MSSGANSDAYDDDDSYDDDDYDYDADDCPSREGCVLGADCLMADPFHSSAECFDLDMAQAYFAEEPEPEEPLPPPPAPPSSESSPTPPEDDPLLS